MAFRAQVSANKFGGGGDDDGDLGAGTQEDATKARGKLVGYHLNSSWPGNHAS